MKRPFASISLILGFSACSHLPQPALEAGEQPTKPAALAAGNQPTEQPTEQPVTRHPATASVEPDWSTPTGAGCSQPQRPGGRPSMADADCRRASNHCLPEKTVFAPSVAGRVAPAFQCGGLWYGWSTLEPAQAPHYQSRPIRDEELAVGADIIYFVPDTARTTVPPSVAQAVGSHWHIGTIARVDQRLGEIYVEKRAVPVSFEAVRLIVK